MASRRALGRRAMCRPLSSAPCVAGLRWILGVYAPLSIAGMGSLVRLWWRRAPGAAFPMAHLISDRATELGTLSLDGAGRAVSGEELLDFRGHPWWRSGARPTCGGTQPRSMRCVGSFLGGRTQILGSPASRGPARRTAPSTECPEIV